MNDSLWKLFSLTGDIRYYILMKEIEYNGNKKSRGNNNK